MIAVTREWVDGHAWIGDQRAAVLELLAERDRAELDLAAARLALSSLRREQQAQPRALDAARVEVNAWWMKFVTGAVWPETSGGEFTAAAVDALASRDRRTGDAAATEALAGAQDGLLKRFASDEPIDDAVGRALAARDKRIAQAAVLEHVAHRGRIHAFDGREDNPTLLACREVIKGGYTSTDQHELVTCRRCLVVALGWTAPGSVPPPELVSRDLVHRALDVLHDEGLVLRDALGRAAVLLREALGP